MVRLGTNFTLLAFITSLSLAQNPSDRRMAFVVGNQAYREKPLITTINDADDMGMLLKSLQFHTSVYRNLNYANFRKAVNDFADSVQGGDTVVFYYAGHGMEVEGKNFLPPVDFDFQTTREAEVSDKAISTNSILKQLRDKKPRHVIFILDACRNNPLRGNRDGGGGLAELYGERGEYIAFATAPGKTASDSSSGGRNGLFTKHLLANVAQPGRTINDVFDQVRVAVDKESTGKQTPWSNSALIGSFYFYPAQPTVDGESHNFFDANPDDVKAALAEGDVYESRSDFERAYAKYTEALKSHPGNQSLLHRLERLPQNPPVK
jgi:uncharacterized caspase-like protein